MILLNNFDSFKISLFQTYVLLYASAFGYSAADIFWIWMIGNLK